MHSCAKAKAKAFEFECIKSGKKSGIKESVSVSSISEDGGAPYSILFPLLDPEMQLVSPSNTRSTLVNAQ